MTKLLRNLFVSCRAAALAVLAVVVLAGCATLESGGGAGAASAAAPAPKQDNSDVIRVGELLAIELMDINPPIKIEQTVGEDRTVTLPMLTNRVVAAGKKVTELQDTIRAEYVPRYFHRMTVNIKRDNQYYFVGGEVKNPSQRPYTGDMTVIRAIKSAGDFTDYASKKDVEIVRSNGTKVIVNAKKAIENPGKYDVPIYPQDTVHVRRSIY